MKNVHGVKHGKTDADRLARAFGLPSSKPAAKKVPPIGGGKGPAPTGAKPRAKKAAAIQDIPDMSSPDMGAAIDKLLGR